MHKLIVVGFAAVIGLASQLANAQFANTIISVEGGQKVINSLAGPEPIEIKDPPKIIRIDLTPEQEKLEANAPPVSNYSPRSAKKRGKHPVKKK